MNINTNHLPKNCFSQKEMPQIDGAVIHYVSAVNVLPNDPFNLNAIMDIFKANKVSAHYLIDRDGVPLDLVPLPKIAFHAGQSRLNGRDRCNNWCIGIELMGGTDFPYTDAQIATLVYMLAQFMSEYKFPLESVQGHDYVRTEWNRAYPDKKGSKKFDPGAHFPWTNVRDSLKQVNYEVIGDL